MKTIKTLLLATTLAALGAAGSPALAQATMDHAKMGDMKMADTGAGEMSDAEIRKIDREQAKVTLKHGPIKNLDMPPMTMVFQVKDRALLDKAKVGDKVRFAVEQQSGAYVVTAIEAAK